MFKAIFSVLILLFCGSIAAQQYQEGDGTLISDQMQDRRTASGHKYNRNELIAAHKSYSFGTRVRVKNLNNGNTVEVVIEDRGAMMNGEIIEISFAAWQKLGADTIKTPAPIPVSITKLSKGKSSVAEPPIAYDNTEKRRVPRNYSEESKKVEPRKRTQKSTEPEDSFAEKKADRKPASTKKKKTIDVKQPVLFTAKGVKTQTQISGVTNLYAGQLLATEEIGYGVQVGHYLDLSHCMKKVALLKTKWFKEVYIRNIADRNYEIIIGKFEKKASANAYKKDLKKKGIDGFVVPVVSEKGKTIQRVDMKAIVPQGFAIQLGVYNSDNNVLNQMNKIAKKYDQSLLMKIEKGNPYKYKILAGPFMDKASAASAKKALAKKGIKGFTVTL